MLALKLVEWAITMLYRKFVIALGVG